MDNPSSNPTLYFLAGKTLDNLITDFNGDIFYQSSIRYLQACVVLQHYLTILSQLGANYGIPGWFFFVSLYIMPYYGTQVISAPVYQIISTVINTLFISQFIVVLLKYIVPLGPLLFLLGGSIRFFPFAKSLGNLILALAIGLYILFPVAVSFVNAFNNSLLAQNAVPMISDGDIIDLMNHFEGVLSALPTQLFKFICSSDPASQFYRLWFNGPLGELVQGIRHCLAANIGFYACFKLYAALGNPLKDLIIALISISPFIPFLIGSFVIVNTGGFNFAISFIYNLADAVIFQFVLVTIEAIFIAIFTLVGAKSVLAMLGSTPQLYSFSKLV